MINITRNGRRSNNLYKFMRFIAILIIANVQSIILSCFKQLNLTRSHYFKDCMQP